MYSKVSSPFLGMGIAQSKYYDNTHFITMASVVDDVNTTVVNVDSTPPGFDPNANNNNNKLAPLNRP